MTAAEKKEAPLPDSVTVRFIEPDPRERVERRGPNRIVVRGNPAKPRITAEQVRDAVANGATTRKEIAADLGVGVNRLVGPVKRAVDAGMIVAGRGRPYRLTDAAKQIAA